MTARLALPKVLSGIRMAGVLLLTVAGTAFSGEFKADEHLEQIKNGQELFRSTVRKTLMERCVACHGRDSIENGFDLSNREGLLKGGESGAVVVAGKSSDSRLLRLIRHLEAPHMPFEEPKLANEAIDAIAAWIDNGAPYDAPLVDPANKPTDWRERVVPDSARNWWAFQPLRPVDIPSHSAGSPIDAFLDARLAAKGILPNARAERRVLLRRLAFDLTGLPPNPRIARDFLNDNSPAAYARLVERLLTDPHYGERWARHWLDVARFAESHGFEHDYDRPFAFHFRDFVIRALNADLPYTDFVRWQLAGDEIAPQNPLAMMATGFLGAGVFPTQITKNEVERTRYDALDDMLATTGTAMLGLTIGCARCHDHKFDPIPQADYYRMLATFTTTVRSEIDVNMDPDGWARAQAQFAAEHDPLVNEIEAYESGPLAKSFEQWSQKPQKIEQQKATWRVLKFTAAKSEQGATLKQQSDGAILVSGANPNRDTFVLTADVPTGDITAVRLEALTHPSLPKKGPGRAGNGNFCLTYISASYVPLQPADGQKGAASQPIAITFSGARATHQQNKGALSVASSLKPSGANGWAVDFGGIGKDQSAIFDLSDPVFVAGGLRLTVRLEFNNNTQHTLGRPRLAVTNSASPSFDDKPGDPHLIAAIQAINGGTLAAELPDEQRRSLRQWFNHRDEGWRKRHAAIAQHDRGAPKPQTEKVMVCSEGHKPMRHHSQGADFFKETYFLHRGDSDRKRGVADQSFLQVLMKTGSDASAWKESPPTGSSQSYRRRSFSNWMVDLENGAGALLARVIVNRLWQHHFGRGLVDTPNDFGTQGELPSHSDLLEWLAQELIRNDWRLKPMHRLIVSSDAYQRASTSSPKAHAADPDNRLCWRYQPRRLEAEVIRDSMLVTAGNLDRRMFGKGTLDTKQRRRSVYFTVKRSRMIPSMQIFDAPEPLVSVGSRPQTTVAPQALMFLNAMHVREAANQFAQRLDVSSHEATINNIYWDALTRRPTTSESAEAMEFLSAMQAVHESEGLSTAQATTAAAADLCQVIFGLSEFIYSE